MLEILLMLLSMFLTNVPTQVALGIITVGCIIALYASIAKYAGHVREKTLLADEL